MRASEGDFEAVLAERSRLSQLSVTSWESTGGSKLAERQQTRGENEMDQGHGHSENIGPGR